MRCCRNAKKCCMLGHGPMMIRCYVPFKLHLLHIQQAKPWVTGNNEKLHCVYLDGMYQNALVLIMRGCDQSMLALVCAVERLIVTEHVTNLLHSLFKLNYINEPNNSTTVTKQSICMHAWSLEPLLAPESAACDCCHRRPCCWGELANW